MGGMDAGAEDDSDAEKSLKETVAGDRGWHLTESWYGGV